MDSNHRYPAPKAGAIAARRHPETLEEYKKKVIIASIRNLNFLNF